MPFSSFFLLFSSIFPFFYLVYENKLIYLRKKFENFVSL